MQDRVIHSSIVLIGAFPPPDHGMSIVNQSVFNQLCFSGVSPVSLNTSPNELSRSLKHRLKRIPKIVKAIQFLLMTHHLNGTKLYMSVSAGFGQIYEIFFALLAQTRGMKLFIHHHSYSYCRKYSLLTHLLIRAAGSDAIQIVLSKKMGQNLNFFYQIRNFEPVSNAVFCFRKNISCKKIRKNLVKIGFLSNISAQKGIYDFINLTISLNKANLPIKAIIAGPFLNSSIEKKVLNYIKGIGNIKYIGPKEGIEKENFFQQIDVLIFPTRYVNEAEPLVILEAMSYCVPTIAYGRGCIPELINNKSGRVIETNEDFVPIAFRQIKAWIDDSDTFTKTSKESFLKFINIYYKSKKHWLCILNLLS